MRTLPVLLLALLCAACQKDDPVAPTEEGYPPATTSAVIGPAGGTIVAYGFSLSVPEGAFATIETLTVTDLGMSEEFGVDALTPLFRVDGVPQDYLLPLTLDLEVQRTPGDGLFLLVGEEGESLFEQETVRSFQPVPADYLSGHLAAVLPPPASGGSLARGAAARPGGDGVAIAKWFLGIDNTDTLLSSGGHFRIIYRRYMEGRATVLAAEFEQAFEAFTAAGFNDHGMMSWIRTPARVEIRKGLQKATNKVMSMTMTRTLHSSVSVVFDEEWITGAPSTAIGAYTARCLGNAVAMVIAMLIFRSDPGMEIDALMKRIWLLQTIVEWAEELGLPEGDRPSYVPMRFPPNWRVPFLGVCPPGDSPLTTHAIGLTPLLRHLVETQGGPKTAAAIYHAVGSQPTCTDALLAGVQAPEYVWFPSFFKRYATGEIYGVRTDSMLSTIEAGDVFVVDGMEDTLKYFEHAYRDLSAKLYRVNLRYDKFSEDASVTFTLGPHHLNFDYVELDLYTCKGSQLGYLSSGTDLTVTDIMQLAEDGYDLVALVVNSANESPYSGTMNIELDVRVSTSLKAEAMISLQMNGTSPTGGLISTWYNLSGDYVEGTMTGNQFYSAFTTVSGSGELSIVFDSEKDRVRQFSLSHTRVSGGVEESWDFASVQDADMPRIVTPSGRQYGVYGATRAPAVIGSYHYKWSYMGVTIEAVMPVSGEDNSFVEVGLR